MAKIVIDLQKKTEENREKWKSTGIKGSITGKTEQEKNGRVLKKAEVYRKKGRVQEKKEKMEEYRKIFGLYCNN